MKPTTTSSILFLLAFLGSFSLNQAQTAKEKQDQLWKAILQDPTPGPWPSSLEILELFLEDLKVTGNRESDKFPEGRNKVIHSVGAIAKVKFVWKPNSYTGLFKKADFGFVRASTASKPSTDGGIDYFIPGISLKFLRDGAAPSGNFFAMYELDGQNDFNFFRNNFCNHVAARPDLPWAQYLVGLKFKTVSEFPGLIGLSDFANFTQEGQKETPNFPFALMFQPNPELTARFENNHNSDIPKLFPTSFNGSEVLYKVYAVNDPTSTKVEYLGTLQLDSKFYSSHFSDVGLFFKHTFIERDFHLKPNWHSQFSQHNRFEKEGVEIYSSWLPPYQRSE